MTKNIARYFDERIMPLIRSRHRDIVSEASIMILGSVGLHIDDAFSDMEAVLYLPDPIWKQNGVLQIDQPLETRGYGQRLDHQRAPFIVDA